SSSTPETTAVEASTAAEEEGTPEETGIRATTTSAGITEQPVVSWIQEPTPTASADEEEPTEVEEDTPPVTTEATPTTTPATTSRRSRTGECPTITSTARPSDCAADLDCAEPNCVFQEPLPIPCGCPRGEDIETVWVQSGCQERCPTGCATSTVSITEY